MTIAEKMVEDVLILNIEEGYGGLTRKHLNGLIATVAERGRKEACKHLTVEEYKIIDAIMLNKWEKEEVGGVK